MYPKMNLLKDIVENTPFPLAVYTGDEFKIEMAYTAMIKIWGKGDQVVGKKHFEVLPELKNEDFLQQATTVLKTGIAFHAKNKKVNLLINGALKTYYFNYSFTPLTDSEDQVYGVMNTAVDVTDLHQAKVQLQSAEERLRMAIESSGIGTYEIDLFTKKVKTCNNFNTIVGVDGEISHKDLLRKLHPEDLVARELAHKKALSTNVISYESRIIKDHSSRWAKISGRVISDERGNNTIIGIVQDIHEQKEFEQELRKQVAQNTEQLKRSNEDLLHFAHVVSHDLKEPVRKIQIFNNILRNEEGNFNESCKKYLNKIHYSAVRMNSIIEGILSYSTVDKTVQPIEKINLGEIIEYIRIDLELVIKEKGAILNITVLPEIEGAPILITQLFYNLIQNALKFSKADQPPRVIITSAPCLLDGRDAVQIKIKDNGIGMDEVFAERIFRPFERLHSKDEFEGNGLGLALCRKIAERHNGTIVATGEIDNGAEFIVTLPLRQTTANV